MGVARGYVLGHQELVALVVSERADSNLAQPCAHRAKDVVRQEDHYAEEDTVQFEGCDNSVRFPSTVDPRHIFAIESNREPWGGCRIRPAHAQPCSNLDRRSLRLRINSKHFAQIESEFSAQAERSGLDDPCNEQEYQVHHQGKCLGAAARRCRGPRK